MQKNEILNKKNLVVLLSCLAVMAAVSLVIVAQAPDRFSAGLLDYMRKFFGAVFTFVGLFGGLYWWHGHAIRKYGRVSDKWKGLSSLVENRPLLILAICVVLILLWLGYIIFKNPYLPSYNQGNGAYFAHVLHNLSNGIGPEETTKSNGALFFSSNPYFFTSVFAITPQLLGYFILTPLYSLHPYPPMHIFAMVLTVITFGSLGVYLAIQAMGGSKTMSLLGALGYFIIPWVELPLLYHGNFDNLGFAVYPYVFAFLFAKRWKLFHLALVALALINIPYTYSVMAIGLTVALFFRAPGQGVVAFLIGFLILQWDMAIVRQSLIGIEVGGNEYPGLFRQLVLSRDPASLIKPVLFHAVYIFGLLMTVSFLPFFAIRDRKKWNWEVIGLLFFALIGAAMGMLRSYHWLLHRNANMIVPVYLAAFLAYVCICQRDTGNEENSGAVPAKRILLGMLLISSIASMTLWYSSNYPWAALKRLGRPMNIAVSHPNNEKLSYVLATTNKFIPVDASVAYRVDAGLEAYIANRQKAWQVGYNPEGVEYYVIQTMTIDYIANDYPGWQERLRALAANKKFELLFQDNIFTIYKSLNPEPIPRLDNVLGWDLLYKALVPGRWS